MDNAKANLYAKYLCANILRAQFMQSEIIINLMDEVDEADYYRVMRHLDRIIYSLEYPGERRTNAPAWYAMNEKPQPYNPRDSEL